MKMPTEKIKWISDRWRPPKQLLRSGVALVVIWLAPGWYVDAVSAQARPASVGGESGGVLTLSLKQAVQLALAKDGNTRVRLAQELVRQARAQSAQQRSSLLPNFDSS